jgi:tetratricopeptide (TPR) repeat protein
VTGRSYFGQERYAEALKEFNEAYRLSHRSAFLYNIGVCYENLGQPEQAIDAFERFLREDTSDRADVEARIAKLRSQVSTSPRPARRERPLYRRGWFWGVVGGAVVVVAAGVTLGVVLGTRSNSIQRLPDLTLGPP